MRFRTQSTHADAAERSVRDVAAELADPAGRPQIIDVREPSEWNEGHIAGATLIPLGQLGARVREIDRAKTVYLVCRSGSRSAYATAALRQAGYDNAYNVSGGMIAWAQARLPIER